MFHMAMVELSFAEGVTNHADCERVVLAVIKMTVVKRAFIRLLKFYSVPNLLFL